MGVGLAGLGDDVRDGGDLGGGDIERGEEAHDGAVATAEFDDKAATEAGGLDFAGFLAVGEGAAERIGFFGVDDFHSEHEAASADVADEGVNLFEVEQAFEEADAHFLDVAEDVVVADVIEGGKAGGHGEGEAAADGLREDEDVGDDAGIFKGVQSAGATPAGLDFVEDEGDGAVGGNLADLAEPGGEGGDGAALASWTTSRIMPAGWGMPLSGSVSCWRVKSAQEHSVQLGWPVGQR